MFLYDNTEKNDIDWLQINSSYFLLTLVFVDSTLIVVEFLLSVDKLRKIESNVHSPIMPNCTLFFPFSRLLPPSKWRTNKNWGDPVNTGDLTLRKIAIWMSKNWPKLDIFFKRIDKNFHFFQKNFFQKNVKFLAIFWQSNGNFPEGQVSN